MYYFYRNASTEQIPDLIIARKDRYFREISFFSMLFLKGGNNFFSRKRNRKVLHSHDRSKTLFQHFLPKIHKWQDEKNKFPETEKWHSRKVVKREKINFMPSTLGCELIRYLCGVREILQKNLLLVSLTFIFVENSFIKQNKRKSVPVRWHANPKYFSQFP